MSRLPAFSTKTRELLYARSGRRCERCNGNGAEYAHRRPRGVRDEHTACPCNACWLCRVCHKAMTVNPAVATQEGYAVSRYDDKPWETPVLTVAGWVRLDCEGSWMPL